MSPLDHKLIRDMWRIKLQAIAIALVVAVGVMLQVMMSGLVTTLEESRDAYYARYRLAEVFAPATRAPLDVLDAIARIPGVASVEGRVQGGALVDVPGQDLPVRAQTLSMPEFRDPRLNDIYLTDGRKLAPGRTAEVILLKGFASAHNLKPGDTLLATMNGARRSFQIVGLAQSPEFMFITAPGEMVPDAARFAVMWMNAKALSAAYDVEGAFNEALIALERGASANVVIDRVDALLDPYGGQGAYERKDQISNRFLTEEISGLKATTVAVPPIFMGVAAFLLYIVISRLVQAEREQIGLIKAFGYTDFEVSFHYFKMVMAIAVFGALLGCALGVISGRAMLILYQTVYNFPFLVFVVDPASFAMGVGVSILSAALGGFLVLRRVFALTPAVAMRPPAPADFSRSGAINERLKRWLDQPSRMILRRVFRNPGRIWGGVIGIAVGMGLSSAQLSLMSGFNSTLETSFAVMDRSDVAVSFVIPMPRKTVFALQHLDGVIEVEPVRYVGVTMRHGRNSYRGGITGLTENPTLSRAIDKDMNTIVMPQKGIVLAKPLADILDIQPGEVLTLEVLEGRRPVIQVPVAGIAETLLGSPAYMRLETLNRALKEPDRVSVAYMRIDNNKADALFRALKTMPAVIGVSQKNDTRAAMQKLMDTGAGAMRYVMGAIAGIITFGIVYNSARIAFGEQSRDLASLRVIGFSLGETAYILLGELALVVLMAIPIGIGIGYYFSYLIAAGFSTDLYQIPTEFRPDAYGVAATAVLIAAVISGWLVKRDINKVDLVETLKTRE